ncbi:MAG: diacylglycerol kinase family lipid kinase [Caldilineaceae bacterium]|nr:diacylglycerol kinase family lipid kinase [Caldilineaceae bacterium]
MTKKVQVIINPAAGGDTPILNVLNTVFLENGVEWDVSITHKAGDARQAARQAVQGGADVVAAYGGDGTVTEAANGLRGTEIPLAILPGGTANVLARELNIPLGLADAARLASGVESKIDRIDLGQMGEHIFLLRVGIGFEAAMVEQADRSLKENFGVLAYWWSALKNLRDPAIARYRLLLDGQETECSGFACTIANSGNLGLPGLQLSTTISVRDGLLDVIVVEEASLRSLTEVLGQIFSKQAIAAPPEDAADQSYLDQIQSSLRHWQAKEISVWVEPAQVIQYDGEILESAKMPLKISVLPQALSVVVPI